MAIKRGPYQVKHVTKNRRAYDKAYYKLNREKILKQHKDRYRVNKTEVMG